MQRTSNAPGDAGGVCFLTPAFYPVITGTTTQIRELARRVVGQGQRVLVVTRRLRPDQPAREQVDGAEVVRVRPAVGLRRSGKFLMMIPALLALIAERRHYQVIIVADLQVLGVIGVLAAKLLGKTCLLRAESCAEIGLPLRPIDPKRSRFGLGLVSLVIAARNRVLMRADGFLSISSATTQEYLAARVPREAIIEITNGVDVDRFRPAAGAEKRELRRRLGLPPGKIFAYSGRLGRGKGLELLLRVWKRLSTENAEAHLVLVGGGQGYGLDMEAELRRLVAEHGLDERVTFTGNVQDVEHWLQAADAFVFPSQTESLGLSLVEALSCGLPAVATRVGGIPDVVQDGVNGILVPYGDEQMLHEAMRTVLSDEERARCMGEAGRRTVVERFNLDLIAGQYQTLLARLVLEGAD